MDGFKPLAVGNVVKSRSILDTARLEEKLINFDYVLASSRLPVFQYDARQVLGAVRNYAAEIFRLDVVDMALETEPSEKFDLDRLGRLVQTYRFNLVKREYCFAKSDTLYKEADKKDCAQPNQLMVLHVAIVEILRPKLIEVVRGKGT